MLHALDRQKIILNNLKIDSVTSINHLIQKTKFHESTIRRDLKILAINQKIVIVRGGVIPLKEIDKKPNIIKNLEQKQKIAKYAAGLIKENDSIIINGGSTCSLIPDYLEKP
jgi:DeoR family fructose operon transcriptional repressor